MTKSERVAERQDGNYMAPIINRPRAVNPIPQWQGKPTK